ncbi:MAG: spore coat protein U domain-containing protein [Sodalis sp. (in: enterobacteria)]
MSKTLLAVSCLAGVFRCYSARAAEATGTINAMLTLTNGCLINGDPATTNANFGNLDFGTHAATFDTLKATMSGAIDNGIRVRCSDGAASHIVQITGSSNPAPSNTPYGTVTANAHYMCSDAKYSGLICRQFWTLLNPKKWLFWTVQN